MSGKATRASRNRAWQKVVVGAEKMAMVAERLRETGTIAGEGDPVEAHANFDAQGRIRPVHARYTNGWPIRVDGTYSLSQAIRFVSQPKGATI